jgi:hypothetical protein
MEIFLRGESGIRLPRKFLIQTAQKVLQKLACNPDVELSIMFVKESFNKENEQSVIEVKTTLQMFLVLQNLQFLSVLIRIIWVI